MNVHLSTGLKQWYPLCSWGTYPKKIKEYEKKERGLCKNNKI